MFKHLRKDFPYLNTNSPIIYFDNAATSQKPLAVLQVMQEFYTYYNAPVYRGVYKRAEAATELYEQARLSVASFINAHSDEIIFTRGTTEGINAIAATWGAQNLSEGDEILLTRMEHHANIVPWIRLAQEKKLIIKYIPLKDNKLDYQAYSAMLNERTKFVGCVYTSNVLGTTNDVKTIITQAHAHGAKVFIDAAQTVGHQKVDVKALQPDFLAFSGHKMLGPTGIGVVYIPRHMQPYVEPYQVGGGMVFSVSDTCAQWLSSPQKYEAGTPAVAEAIGLQAAINYLRTHISFDELQKHQSGLTSQLHQALQGYSRVKILSPDTNASHMVTFTIDGMHAHDVAAYLDTYNIAVRAGHHCAQPLHNYLGIESSIRASFYLYNTQEEVDLLIQALNTLLA